MPGRHTRFQAYPLGSWLRPAVRLCRLLAIAIDVSNRCDSLSGFLSITVIVGSLCSTCVAWFFYTCGGHWACQWLSILLSNAVYRFQSTALHYSCWLISRCRCMIVLCISQ